MVRSAKKTTKEPEQKVGLFKVLGPYRGIIVVLIIMALGGSSINLLIPKIIARAIDAFSAGKFDAGKVITEFLIAAYSFLPLVRAFCRPLPQSGLPGIYVPSWQIKYPIRAILTS